MSIESFRVMKAVQDQINQLDDDRVGKGEPVDYLNARDAMVPLHTEWQDLMVAVKASDISGRGVKAAIRLAAAAMKFATDLGNHGGLK